MEQERILIDPTLETEEMPPRPHFDEEATLLRARPVVPLKEVQTGTHNRRTLLLGMALVAALLLGAVSAMLFDRFAGTEKGQTSDVVDSGSSHSDKQDSNTSGSSGSLDYAGGRREESKDSVTPSSTTSSTGRETESNVATEKKSSGRVSVAFSAPGGSKERSSRADLHISRLQQKRKEQREIRQRRRTRELDRQLSDPASRDLFRIREIFEGEQPPH